MSNYSTQNSLLLENLLDFYSRSDNLDRVLPIINGKSKISLRLIDWFATNYCKKHYVVYNITEGDTQQRFKVYQDYKLKLKAYSKRRFDPFCRWERITIPYKNDTCIETTIGQLNFFRWYIENKILDYIEENFEKIENDMNNRNSISKKRVQKHSAKSNNKTNRFQYPNLQKKKIFIPRLFFEIS